MKWRLGMTGVMGNRQRQGFETQDTTSAKSKFLSLSLGQAEALYEAVPHLRFRLEAGALKDFRCSDWHDSGDINWKEKAAAFGPTSRVSAREIAQGFLRRHRPGFLEFFAAMVLFCSSFLNFLQLFVLLQFFRCKLERPAVLLYRREHKLAVGFERLASILERMMVLIHGLIHAKIQRIKPWHPLPLTFSPIL